MTVSEYNQCVDLYSDGVYRFILHNLRDKDEAKDVVQDTYEKLWMNYSNVNFEKSKSYIFTTAYHTMIDRIRKSKRTVRANETEMDVHTTTQQPAGIMKVLREAVSRLPEIQKSVIMLRDYEGYSYQEIGEITGLNESQVKVYIYRARTFLKSYLGSVENII